MDAWEIDVEKLATKTDLQQVEARLTASITELRSEMKVMRWQLGAIFICVVVPLVKMAFGLLPRL